MSRSAENNSYSFIMPECEVIIEALVLRETYHWEVQDGDTLLATIERDNVPFDQPKGGKVILEIYVDDPTSESHEVSKATQEFYFNYTDKSDNTAGFASVDLNIKPTNGYHIYKVNYSACYGQRGPVNTGWNKDNDDYYFTMDNVTEDTCAKIYLTKLYTVKYDFEVDGQPRTNASDYLGGYPTTETLNNDLFHFKPEAIITACDKEDIYHQNCPGKKLEIVPTVVEAFENEYPHTLITNFTVPTVTLNSDIAEKYTLDNGGRWKGAGEGFVEQGTSLDLIDDRARVAGLISSTNPYVIPLTISISSTKVPYTTEHYLEQSDGRYKIDSTETAQAKLGSTVTALPKKYDHYTENTRHEGQVDSGTVTASPELTLKLYYDLNTHSVTFNSGDHGTFPGIGSSVSSDHKYGSSFPKVPSPKPEEGYQFDGWYDASNNKVNKFPDSITGNLTYTAHWTNVSGKPIASDITYKTEHYLEQPDGSYKLGSTETAQAKPGLSVTASPKTYDHHTENTRHEGRVDSGTVTASPELTLKLYYDLDTHRVTFNSGDHGTLSETGSSASFEHKYGSRFPTVPSPTPEEGYQFDGWYDASGNRVNTFPVAIYENLTYTAHWTVIDDNDDDEDEDEEPAPSPAAITIRSPKTGENPLLWGSSAGVIISAAGFAFLLILKRKG